MIDLFKFADNEYVRDVWAMVGQQQLQLKPWLHIVPELVDEMALGLYLAVSLAEPHLKHLKSQANIYNSYTILRQ